MRFSEETMHIYDFSRSYFRFRIDLHVQPAITVTHAWTTTLNNVRIHLESRCELVHRITGKSHVYVLSASCKTERVGVKRDCWMQPNADFCVAASDEEFLVLKNWAHKDMPVAIDPGATGQPLERQSGLCREAWADFGYELRPAEGRTLDSIEDLIAVVQGDRPLVAHNEYDDGDYRVCLDYPVKTINFSERERVYQTDTGPILLPDLSPARLAHGARLIDCFDLAYAAFNSEGWAEFIVNVPTPVGEGIRVNHYSRPRRIEPVHNVLIELQEESPVPRHHLARDRATRADGSQAFAP
jgi:hypothetical protein